MTSLLHADSTRQTHADSHRQDTHVYSCSICKFIRQGPCEDDYTASSRPQIPEQVILIIFLSQSLSLYKPATMFSQSSSA